MIYDAVLLGISKSKLKESLQKIILNKYSYELMYSTYSQKSIDNFNLKMKESLKKYGLEKIELETSLG